MDAEAAPVLVALPGTLCSPTVFEPLTAALAGEVTVDPVSWLTWWPGWARRPRLRRVAVPATSPRRPP